MNGLPNDAADPGELLRALRPQGRDDYLSPGEDTHAEELLQRVMSLTGDTRRPSHRTRRVVVLAVGLTVVGASAAAAVIISRSAGNPTEVSCYSASNVGLAEQVVVIRDRSRTPLEQCAELWTDGRLSTRGAPQLVACVTDADIVAVLPGDESSCAAAGWDISAEPSSEVGSDQTSALTDVLSGRFGGQCIGPDEAPKVVEDVLRQLQLTDWTVVDKTTNPDWCAAPVVDVDTRMVSLVSHPQ